MADGGLHGVFAARTACCGVAGATGVAWAADGFADDACSKDSGVAEATSGVEDVSSLTASG